MHGKKNLLFPLYLLFGFSQEHFFSLESSVMLQQTLAKRKDISPRASFQKICSSHNIKILVADFPILISISYENINIPNQFIEDWTLGWLPDQFLCANIMLDH